MLFTMASEARCPAPPSKFSFPPPSHPNIPLNLVGELLLGEVERCREERGGVVVQFERDHDQI